jgi:hypothetical protein
MQAQVAGIQKQLSFIRLGEVSKKLQSESVKTIFSGYNLIRFSPRPKDEV